MKYWFFATVILVTNSSFAYNFTPNTQCVLCSTVIRCGPGVDAVIRPNQSGREMSVEKHCAQISNERDPRYRELRNIFSKNRFTYQEYLDKVPVLTERRIDISPKPLIGPNELLNTGRLNDLQNYTDYILDAVDPKQDKNLEVNADGKLVNKLDRQPQKVRDDLKARMPSSENSAIKRNGAWVSPEQEPYINPLSNESSGAKAKRSAVTPTPTPVEWWDDSFRRDYCRGKTTRECDDLWVLRSQKEEKPKSKKEEKVPTEKVKTTSPITSSAPSVSAINPSAYSPTSSFGSEGLGAGNARMPSSLASSTTGATTSVTNTQMSAVKPTAVKSVGGNASAQVPGTGVLKLENLPISGNYKQDIMSSLTMMNTSPSYKSLIVPTPYGTVLDIKVQPSGALLSSGRPLCDSLEQWRTTSFFVDALRNIDPNNTYLYDAAIGKGILGATGYCYGNNDFDRMKCEFRTPQAACSCNDYGTKHLLNRCNEMFDIPTQPHEAITIDTCKNKLQSLIRNDKGIAPKFARPYALTLGETYLCLNVSDSARKACNDKVTQTISSMSDKECTSLYTALGPDASKYITNPRNQKNLESYSWFKLYKYHADEFKLMFGETNLNLQPKALVKGRSCQQQIRGVLEDMVSQLNRDHLNEVEKLNTSTATELSQLRNRIVDLCTNQNCKKDFSDKIIRNFATPTSDADLSSKRASEMKDLSSLYRDLTVYNNLNEGYCNQSKGSNSSSAPSAPKLQILNPGPTGPTSPAGIK